MTRKQKKTLIRIIVAAVLLIAAVLLNRMDGGYFYLGENRPPLAVPFLFEARPAQDAAGNGTVVYLLRLWWLYLIPCLIIGWDILWKAIRNIGHGQIFDENFLM